MVMEDCWSFPDSTPPPKYPRILSVPHSEATVSALDSPEISPRSTLLEFDREDRRYRNKKKQLYRSTRKFLNMERSAAAALSSGTARVGLSEEAKAVVKREKEFIKFRVPSLSLFPNQTSRWGQVLHVDWSEFESLKQQIPSLNLDVNKGLAKLMQTYRESFTPEDASQDYKVMSRRVVICPICFRDPDVSLFTSIVMCGRGLTSNIGQHRRGVHNGVEFPKTTKPGPSVAVSSKSVTSSSQSSISRFISNQPLNRQQAISAVKDAIYQCVNDCGFASHTVEKPIFRQLLNTVRENAQFLKQTDLQISTRSLETMRINSYSRFINLVKDLGGSVRDYYESRCGKTIPFATICHDIWQGKKKDILGVSLMFADPRNCVMYQIPIGLVQTKGHSALQVSEVTLNLMLSFGFDQSDLSASVNDNTNSAVLAGKYILGTAAGGKCDMHKAELVVKHATGIAERTERKQVVDTNLPFRALYKKFHKFSSWLMSKRCPTRWTNFKNFCLHNNSVVVEIALPGDTRVAGVEIMFQSLIRIKWQMDDYASRSFLSGETHAEFKSKYPKQEDWILLSEFEGILAPLQKFAMTLQSEEPGANSASLMEAYTMRHQVAKMRTGTVSIISLEAGDYDIQSTWDGSVPLSLLDKKRIEKRYEDLHSASQLLIDRLFKEYQTYFMDTVDKSGEFGICSNPLLVDIVPKFFFFLSAFKATDTERMYRSFIADMVEKHWVPPSNKIGADEVALPLQLPNQEPRQSSNTDPIKRKMNDIFAAFLASEVADTNTSVLNPDPNALTEEEHKAQLWKECEEAFNYYVNDCKTQINDWSDIIEQYPSKKYQSESKNWSKEERANFQEYCNMKNYCMIGKFFDVMAWWRINGPRFSKVFPSAIVALSQPATNAFQERVFSLASWFDSNRLMNRQFPKNFEMRTMEAVTRKMRKEIVANESMLESQAKLDHKQKKNANTRSHVPNPSTARYDGAATTRQLMNMTTYIHRFNTTGTLAENRDTDPGKSVSMEFVARYTDLAASAAQLARVSCVPAPNEPVPCGDVTEFVSDGPTDGDDIVAEEVQEVVKPVNINEKGISTADGVQVLALKYDSDMDDDDTDDDGEFDTDKMLLENLQTILEARNTVVVDDDDEEDLSSDLVTSPPSRKVRSPVVDDGTPVGPGVASPANAVMDDEGFLGWMNNPSVTGVPCVAPAAAVPAGEQNLKRSCKGAPASSKSPKRPKKAESPKRPKKQALLPQRKTPTRAAKTQSEIAKERLAVPKKATKKTEEEVQAEIKKRRENLHQSQSALMKKRIEEREKKEKDAVDEAVKLSLASKDPKETKKKKKNKTTEEEEAYEEEEAEETEEAEEAEETEEEASETEEN